MLIKRVHLKNLLSFGPKSEPVELKPLNVFIGPNSSGKSNFLDAINLTRSTGGDLWATIRAAGTTSEWIHKGEGSSENASIEVVVEREGKEIRYSLEFTQRGGRFEITDERIERTEPEQGHSEPYFFYRFQAGRPVLNTKRGGKRTLEREEIDPQKSILIQRRDPDAYPELAWLADQFAAIRCYRGWPIAPMSPLRQPQRTDGPNQFLLEDGSNLALVLNKISLTPGPWRRLIEVLKSVYDGIEGLTFEIDSNTVRASVQEKWFTTPASRMSDGTLRFLCLLAVLLAPSPAPLICIDEPELGLHPDVVHKVAGLLRDASTRTQLIVTTHSAELLDALSDEPECVSVFERVDGQTTVERLAGQQLLDWLKEYGIGRAWRDGEIGGNRW